MATTPIPSLAPIALQPGDGDARWFLGVLATIKSSAETTNGRVAVIEHLAAQGAGSPLHVHHNEDEWFYVTEGELTFWVGGQVIEAPAGSFVYGPRDVPHTFTVTSPTARFLLVAEPAGFESFVRDLSEPAQALTLPPPARSHPTSPSWPRSPPSTGSRSSDHPASPPEARRRAPTRPREGRRGDPPGGPGARRAGACGRTSATGWPRLPGAPGPRTGAARRGARSAARPARGCPSGP